MCLILLKPANAEFDERLLANAQDTNPHGVGFMMPSGKGTVYAAKGLWTPEKVLQFWRKHQHKTIAVHFRMRTQGQIDIENCHPFQVLRKERNGIDLWMMHNGTIHTGHKSEPNKSDTYNFVQYTLKPLLAAHPGRIYDEDFQRFISNKIGNWNKLLFMDGAGRTIIINQNRGTVRNGCWLSNTYSIRDRTPARAWGRSSKYDDSYYFDYNENWLSGPVGTNKDNKTSEIDRIIDAEFEEMDDPFESAFMNQPSKSNPGMKWITTRDEHGWPSSGQWIPVSEDHDDGDEIQ
jgi:predicted glutamine amidotransferase